MHGWLWLRRRWEVTSRSYVPNDRARRWKIHPGIRIQGRSQPIELTWLDGRKEVRSLCVEAGYSVTVGRVKGAVRDWNSNFSRCAVLDVSRTHSSDSYARINTFNMASDGGTTHRAEVSGDGLVVSMELPVASL